MMTASSQWVNSSRDVKFRAVRNGDTIVISGKVGRHDASDTYRFQISEYPDHPYEQKCFLDRLYRTFEQHPDLVGQASRHTDAIQRAVAKILPLRKGRAA